MNVLLLASALLIGCLLAVQAAANLQLNKAVGTPYGASTLQLWFAAALLLVLALGVGALGALGGVLDVPAWFLLGGLASPLYITSGILLFPRMGALAAGGLFVTGQMLASLAVDLLGLFGTSQRPLSVGIVAGAIAVLVGITTIIRGEQRRTAKAPVGVAAASGGAAAPPAPIPVARVGAGWLALGVIAGAALPIQGAINAQLRGAWHQPIAVALFSFFVAAVTISVVLAVLLAAKRTPQPHLAPLARMPWWGWLGGACAAAYVTGTFLLIPAIGAAVTVALTITGQQLASAAVDAGGFFRLPKRPISTPRTIGLLLLVAGSLLVQLL